MIFSKWKILAFVAICVAGMTLLVALPAPHGSSSEIDSRTGQRILGTVELIAQAKELGDAQLAFEKIRAAQQDAPDDPHFASTLAGLRDELSPLRPPDEEAPALRRLSSEELDLYSLTDLLDKLLADQRIAEATERFFARAATDPAPENSDTQTPDRRARDALAQIRSHGKVDPAVYLETARTFRRAGRPRGHARWLLRGYRAHPDSTEIRNALIELYVSLHRLDEAFAISSHALKYAPDDLPFWKHRSTLASWLSRPALEAPALQRVFELNGDPRAAKRLLDLYVHLGKPERAVPFAVSIAEGAGELAEFEKAARLALSSGLPERALELLEKIADGAGDPTPWREMIVECALQDLRVDRAVAELQQLDADNPEGGYDARLEDLYRRLNRPADLVDLLERRLVHNPAQPQVWREALTLAKSLGDQGRTDALLAKMVESDLGPLQFFRNLRHFRRAGLGRVEARGMQMAQSANLDPTIVGDALVLLRPLLREQQFRHIAESILTRFPEDEAGIAFRLELVDSYDSLTEQVQAAESLAAKFPQDTTLLRAWADRAGWAGLSDSEVRARRALLALQPDDIDCRVRLAEVHSESGQHDEALAQWRSVVAARGPHSPLADRLVAALLASGDVAEALEWMEKRASHPEATLDDKAGAAETLFANNHPDLAAVYYRAVLELDTEHPLALLRLGQIHSWSNDPRSAIAYLDRRLAVTDADRELVDYYLGEALWSVGDTRRAGFLHQRSLDAMRDADQTVPVRSMMARMLFRLDRTLEAEAIYAQLVDAAPADINVILDYAEVLVHQEDLARARDLVDRAHLIDGNDARYLRVEGQLLTTEGRLAEARATLSDYLTLHGPHAGVHADLGRAYELDGDWLGALDHYRRWLSLQTQSADAARSVRSATDQVSDVGLGRTHYRRVGDDRTIEADAGLSLLVDSERTRLNLRAGYGSYRGRAQAVANGTQDVDEDVALLDAAICHRLDGSWLVGGGVSAFPGAPGNVPVGAWAALHIQEPKPFSIVGIRALVNELLTEPAASVGLEGRQHGIELQAYRQIASRWWTGANAALYALEVDPPDGPSETDGYFRGEASLGFNILEGPPAVGDTFAPRRCPAGPISPPLIASEEHLDPPLLNTWVTFQSSYLLGDRGLADLIPIGKRFNYLIASARADKQLATGLGASLEARIGLEFSESDSIWGANLSLTWRPKQECELSVGGEIGDALGRTGDDGTHGLFGRFILRW